MASKRTVKMHTLIDKRALIVFFSVAASPPDIFDLAKLLQQFNHS
jgi:hypothetical protein